MSGNQKEVVTQLSQKKPINGKLNTLCIILLICMLFCCVIYDEVPYRYDATPGYPLI